MYRVPTERSCLVVRFKAMKKLLLQTMTCRWRLGTASSLMTLIMAHLTVIVVMVTTGASRYQHQSGLFLFFLHSKYILFRFLSRF